MPEASPTVGRQLTLCPLSGRLYVNSSTINTHRATGISSSDHTYEPHCNKNIFAQTVKRIRTAFNSPHQRPILSKPLANKVLPFEEFRLFSLSLSLDWIHSDMNGQKISHEISQSNENEEEERRQEKETLSL